MTKNPFQTSYDGHDAFNLGYNAALSDLKRQDSRPQEHDLDNALVSQKNKILSLINEGQLEKASVLVEFLTDLWRVCDYAYKAGEINARIDRAYLEKVS